jgi:hypothetical protein
MKWCYTVYRNINEQIPKDALGLLGNYLTTVTYTDANLYHDILTGRSVTRILHPFNQTLIEWYSKLQVGLEAATF